MSAHVCAHCGDNIQNDDHSHRRTVAKALTTPVKTRGLLDPPGRRAIERTYVVSVVEVVCAECHERLEEEDAALEHFHKLFISIIGVICLLFIICMIIPDLRARILDFVHPDKGIYE
jgi:hypothetical protein